MSHPDRRSVARRRAWGRGPHILRFEPLEGRALLSTVDPVASIASTVDVAEVSTDTMATTTVVNDTNVTNVALAATTTAAPTTATTTTTSTTPVTTTASPGYDGSNLVATAFNTPHNLDWGDSFHVTGAVQNVGSTPTKKPYQIDVYASTSPSGANAVYLGSVQIPAGLSPGTRTDYDQVVSAPLVPLNGMGSSPSYYITPLLVAVDNNTPTPVATSGASLSSVVTVTPKVPPKLVGAGVTVTPGSIAWGDTITVTAKVKNDSTGVAPPTNARIVLTPEGRTPGGGSDYQIGQVPIPPIGAFQTVSASQKITLPLYAPTALSGTAKFTVTMFQDADASANPLMLPSPSTSANDTTKLAITPPAILPVNAPAKPAPADLKVTNVLEPSPTMFRGATFPVGATIQNSGSGDAGSFKVRFLLVTDESANAPALVLGDATIPEGLKAGMQQDVLQTVTLPYRTPDAFEADSSTARIVVQVDPDRKVDQSNTANDTLAAPRVQLRVLTADGQTQVPILPGGTTTPAATGTGTTTTTAPVASGTKTTGFETATVAATAVPVAATPAATPAPTTTPTPTTPSGGKMTPRKIAAQEKAAARKAAIAAKAAARKAAAKARAESRAARMAVVRTQIIARKANRTNASAALRLYQPSNFSTSS